MKLDYPSVKPDERTISVRAKNFFAVNPIKSFFKCRSLAMGRELIDGMDKNPENAKRTEKVNSTKSATGAGEGIGVINWFVPSMCVLCVLPCLRVNKARCCISC